MRNKLLSIAAVLFIAVCSLLPQRAKANHGTGGELIYIHLGDSAYQFIFKFYRDCTGPQAPGAFALCAYNTLTNSAFTLRMDLWDGQLPPDNRENGSPISPGCSNSKTTCNGGTVPGYEEWWYSCIVPRLPFRTSWKFGVLDGTFVPFTALCCRNASNNLNTTALGTFYVESGLNSKNTWRNSSPYYSIKPVPYVCLNTPYEYNNGALDRDGDSLWTSLTRPLGSASCSTAAVPVPFVQPPASHAAFTYNITNNPFQTNNSFVLNGSNGQFGFTPTLAGKWAMATLTEEYRRDPVNGTYQIGYIMRDMQVQVLVCDAKPPKVDTLSIDHDNGSFIGKVANGCIGQKLQFCMMISSADTETVWKVSDNLVDNKAFPGAKITYTNQGTDSVKMCFEWTPADTNVGKNSIILIIRDSTCKAPGILFTYAVNLDINIWAPIKVVSDADTICAGEPSFLGVTGGGDYRWTVLTGTPNSLSDSTVHNPIATPRVNTRYIVRSTLNSYCKSGTRDTVDIDVLPGTEIVGQQDDTTCPGYAMQLNLGMKREPGINYTVSWTPATGLSSTTIENPVTTLKDPVQYIATIVSTKNRCKTYDTVNIDVLKGMKIDQGDQAICFGQSVDITGLGDPRYTYTWSSKDQNAQYSSPGAIQNTITPSAIGTYAYVLTGTYYKCAGKDTVGELKIDVQPVPDVKINDDITMCFGDTVQLEAIITPANYDKYTYSWSPGAMLDYTDRAKPIFSAVQEGKMTLKLVATTPVGCTGEDEVNIEVFAPDFLKMPNDTSICPGDTISLALEAQEGAKFYWLPDYNISSISSSAPRVWPVTDQTYIAFGVDSFGCLDTQSVRVEVRPAAVLELPDSVILYPGESYRVDPGGNCLYYTWFPPLGLSGADISNPVASPKVNTRYIVQGRNEAGCGISETMDILVVNDAILNLPNAFTPGRRENGTLKIVRRGIADLKTFAVYNRWGTKVFETSDINEGWDGTYNGETQPMGVYIYAIEAVDANGQTMRKQGNVTMLR